MIIGTSALLAILRTKAEARSCANAIEQSAVRRIWAGNVLEGAIVIGSSRDPIASHRLDDLLLACRILRHPALQHRLERLEVRSELLLHGSSDNWIGKLE